MGESGRRFLDGKWGEVGMFVRPVVIQSLTDGLRGGDGTNEMEKSQAGRREYTLQETQIRSRIRRVAAVMR